MHGEMLPELPSFPSFESVSQFKLPVDLLPEQLLPWGVQKWQEMGEQSAAGDPAAIASSATMPLQRLNGGEASSSSSGGDWWIAVGMGSGISIAAGVFFALALGDRTGCKSDQASPHPSLYSSKAQVALFSRSRHSHSRPTASAGGVHLGAHGHS